MKKLINNKSATTAVEYGLIASLIALAIVAAMQTLAPQINTTFDSVTTAMKDAHS